MSTSWNNPSGRRATRSLGAALGAAALLAPLTAAAPARAALVALDSVHVYTAARASSDRSVQRWDSARRTTRSYDDALFGLVNLETAGCLYHPRLLAFHLEGSAALQRRYLSAGTGTPTLDVRDVFSDYAAGARVFDGHRLSFALGASRQNSDVTGDLLRDTQVEREWRMGSATLQLGRLRQRAEYARTHYTSAGQSDNEEIRHTARYTAELPGRRVFGQIRYDYTQSDLVTSHTSFTSQIGNANATFRLDEHGRSSFIASSYYARIESQSLTETIEGSGRLRLVPWSWLGTALSWTRRHSNTGGLRSWTDVATFSVDHRLYQSLFTSVSGRGTFTDYDDGRQEDRTLEARVDYRKHVPVGRIRMFYEYGLRRNEERFDRMTPRRRERVETVEDGVPIVIDEENVDATSIVVVNLSRPAEPPVEGIDYVVRVVGDVVEIIVQPAGTIRDGDRIRITWEVLVSDQFGFDERTPGRGAGLDLGRVLSVTVGERRTERTLRFGTPVTPLGDTHVRYATARARLGRLSLQGRWQDRRSPTFPYRQASVSALWQVPDPAPAMMIAINGSATRTEFVDEDDREDLVTAGGYATWSPTPRVHADARLTWFDRRGRRNDGRSVVGSFNLRYRAGRMEIVVRVNAWEREVVGSGTEQRGVAMVELRRHL